MQGLMVTPTLVEAWVEMQVSNRWEGMFMCSLLGSFHLEAKPLRLEETEGPLEKKNESFSSHREAPAW